LEDARQSVLFILGATEGKSIDDYRSQPMLKAAVERHFEIIGEAVRRLSKHDPEVTSVIKDYQQIIAFRNVLIHGYDLINDEQVWRVIRENLPTLLETRNKMLKLA